MAENASNSYVKSYKSYSGNYKSYKSPIVVTIKTPVKVACTLRQIIRGFTC